MSASVCVQQKQAVVESVLFLFFVRCGALTVENSDIGLLGYALVQSYSW
jgi:hypothetical protein